MAIPNDDKHKEYARYGAYCLLMVVSVPDQESRDMQREMAAEWLKLAGVFAAVHDPRKCRWSD